MSTLPGLSPLGQAIANAEGYGVPGAIPTLNNNPGDLTDGGKILSYGSITDGINALQSQVTAMLTGSSKYYNPSMTIAEVGQTYANGDPAWAANVSNYLGVSPDTPIGQLQNGPSLNMPDGTQVPFNKLPNWLQNAVKKTPPGFADKYIGNGVSWFLSTPFVMLVIGIILIAAGVFSFKTTTTAINTATKAVKKGAKVYAESVA